MLIVRQDIPATYLASHVSNPGIKAATSSYRAWNDLTLAAEWAVPQDVIAAHSKASILKSSRVVFNIKGNDYRLICKVNYQAFIVEIRWFGSHAEYDRIDAEAI